MLYTRCTVQNQALRNPIAMARRENVRKAKTERKRKDQAGINIVFKRVPLEEIPPHPMFASVVPIENSTSNVDTSPPSNS